MVKYNKIIFLDEEDTALSPLAGEILKKKLKEGGFTDIKAYSRGNVVLFPEPANQKIMQIAEQNGLDLSAHVAKALEAADFEERTLVLALDIASKKKAYSKYTNAANVYTLREYIGEQGDIKFQPGKNIEEYFDTYLFLERTIIILLEKIID